MKLAWTPLALERAEEIAAYIALDKPAAALDWLTALFARIERLEQHPRSGRKVPETDTGRIRELIHGTYRVIYALDEATDCVHVLTIRRSSEKLRRSELGRVGPGSSPG